MKFKQRIKKLEKALQINNTEIVPIGALIRAELEGNNEELQRCLKILRDKPPHLREKPIGYEKYFND